MKRGEGEGLCHETPGVVPYGAKTHPWGFASWWSPCHSPCLDRTDHGLSLLGASYGFSLLFPFSCGLRALALPPHKPCWVCLPLMSWHCLPWPGMEMEGDKHQENKNKNNKKRAALAVFPTHQAQGGNLTRKLALTKPQAERVG